MKSIPLDISIYNALIEGKMTFHHATALYYEEIAKYWNRDTRSIYNARYNEVLFPIITDKKPLRDLDEEYFLSILDKLSKEHKMKNGDPATDSMMSSLRRLIRKVIVVASQHNECDDCVWGTSLSKVADAQLPSEEDDEAETNEVYEAIAKTLTPRQERFIYKETMTDPMQSGENMGLLLMNVQNLRNEEACALDFGDIQPITGHEGCYCVYIYKSTDHGSSELKIGGKTVNSPRAIPLTDKQYLFIKKREIKLEKMCKESANKKSSPK